MLLSGNIGKVILVLGTGIVTSDYRFLRGLGKNSWYHWVQQNVTDRTVERKIDRAKEEKVQKLEETAVQKHERSQFLTRGPEQIDVTPKGNGDLTGHPDGIFECVHSGLPFYLYVNMEMDSGLTYPLRVAKVEVTKVRETTEPDEDAVAAFFSVTEWLDDEWDNDDEKERLNNVGEDLKSGESTDNIFVKPDRSGDVNEFDTDEWRTIVDWISGQ